VIGKNAPGLTGFPTPDNAAGIQAYLLFLFEDPLWAQYLLGAAKDLVFDYNWYQAGEMTTDEAAEAFRLIIEEAPYNRVPATVGTPFWDDAEDVDDEMPADTQIWYGEVSDPEAPPGELDFVENAALWVGAGLIALATGSVGAALAFRTFVGKFILIQKAGDVGETIRYVVDNQDMATINTGDYAPGTLIETPIIADPDLSTHQIYIVRSA